MCGIVASKGTEEETEKIFRGIMAENFTNFMKTIKPQMQELKESKAQEKEIELGHRIVKMLKTCNKNIRKSQGIKTHYTQRNKDKGDNRFLIGNNASEETVEKKSN